MFYRNIELALSEIWFKSINLCFEELHKHYPPVPLFSNIKCQLVAKCKRPIITVTVGNSNSI